MTLGRLGDSYWYPVTETLPPERPGWTAALQQITPVR